MDRAEFMAGVRALVGEERGVLVRGAAHLGVTLRTMNAISEGNRPVPAAAAERLRAALREAEASGECLRWLAPRLSRLVGQAEGAGFARSEAVAAVTAWGGLRLSRAAPLRLRASSR